MRRRTRLFPLACLALAAACSSAATTSAPPPSAVETGGSPVSASPAADGTSATPAAGAASPTAVQGAPPQTSPGPSIDLSVAPAVVIKRSHVPIMTYHQIREWKASDSKSARAYIMPPAVFTSQLDALVAAGYHTITPDQLTAYLTTGAPLPDKPVMLTFDDGDADGARVALPELTKRGMTGTFFVMTVVLGKPPTYMTKDQVRQLDAAGMTVAAHTWDHHRVDRYAGEDWQKQIIEPTQELESIVGHPLHYFAYPYGAWSPEAFPHLKDAGFYAAFQLDSKPIDPNQPLYAIQRMIANPYWSTATFMKMVQTGF